MRRGGRPWSASSFDPSHGTCEGRGPVVFEASPFDLEEIEVIQPMGNMIGGHVTPIDHGHIFGRNGRAAPPDTFHIRSPARGFVVELSRTRRSEGSVPFIDHAMTIEFSCSLYVHYSNMSSFAPRLLREAGAIGENETRSVRIPVAGGELVGRTGRYGIDISVWDLDLTLPGFIVPAHYFEGRKRHSADLFQYYREPLRGQLLAKNLRQAEPRFGKIDYDQHGRLVGNWFLEGAGGYAGSPSGRPGEAYWQGHLAIAYDALDPRGIVVSIGNWDSEARQFGVKGNAPDPQDVTVQSGLVKYELLRPDWKVASTGAYWDRMTYVRGLRFAPHEDRVEGVVLLQLVSDRRLKAEFFPNEAARDVTGFTAQAVFYER